ncbi:hypothetical protein EDD15DRAFT_2477295 [Pisolithus albus]|nr:hypothetical protein EDD15DRAFT_2477295 [Pisolithus albus]
MADSEATIIAFVNSIRPVFPSIILNAAFAACVFTLFVLLLALSTKESRRRLVFRLNVLAICLVLTMGALTGLVTGKAIVDPFNLVSTNTFIAAIIFLIFPPLLYDSILLTRLFALYPFGSTPATTLVKIFAFPLCIKCARVVVITIGVHGFVGLGTTTEALIQAESADWFRSPYLIAEWSMQIADNLYTVSLFLYNLHIRTSSMRRGEGATFIAERIRQIFYISFANFVFPLIFNVAQIFSITTDRSPTAGGLLIVINNYVTVVGVLCATLWFSGSEWARTRNELLPEHMLNTLKPTLGRVGVAGGMSGSPVASVGKGTVPHHTADLDPGVDSKQLLTWEKENRHILV